MHHASRSVGQHAKDHLIHYLNSSLLFLSFPFRLFNPSHGCYLVFIPRFAVYILFFSLPGSYLKYLVGILYDTDGSFLSFRSYWHLILQSFTTAYQNCLQVPNAIQALPKSNCDTTHDCTEHRREDHGGGPGTANLVHSLLHPVSRSAPDTLHLFWTHGGPILPTLTKNSKTTRPPAD